MSLEWQSHNWDAIVIGEGQWGSTTAPVLAPAGRPVLVR